MAQAVRDVPIRDAVIRLGQFLQLANIVDSGADAKAVIAAGEVSVNGQTEMRRGRQLHPGDTIAFGDQAVRVTTA